MATKKQELEQANRELAYWNSFAEPIGYKVYGWTYTNHAQFISPTGHIVEVDGKILELIHQARRNPYPNNKEQG